MNKKSKMMQSGLALIVALGMLLAGCGAKNEGGATDSKTSPTTKNGKDLAPYEVTMAFFGSEQKDLQAVQDEMNKILKEKINTTVKLTPISISAWQQQTNLMLAGNEKIDLMFTSAGFNYGTQVAKGQLVQLDDLVEKYGSGIKKALEPYQLSAAKINGKSYAIPAVKDMASDYGILMRKDLVDKYKIDLSKIKSINDLDAVFQTIKDNEPNMVPLVAKNPGTGPFYAGYVLYDSLSGGIGVLPDYDNNMKVVNWYETAQYADQLNVLRKWYQSGYLLKDASTSKQDGRELVKNGKAFAYFSNLKPDSDVEASRKSGKEMTVVRLTPAYATTDMITSMMWSVPKNSEDPDRAMMVLNLLYSDKQLYNLFAWGIEGKHYVKKSENVIDYPAGVDITNTGYNFGTPYMFGNQFLSYTWSTGDPDIWKKTDQFNKGAKKSKALGFIFDVEKVKTEMAAVNNVLTEYVVGLETGTLDPAENLPKFIAKLKSAGIDNIISEKQKQLDEWAKTQK
ncbi:ABC transporter substrate-binding protein [Paenibacillus alkaliterrae]|uniref:ABC transporter substrate-binding protein n=1 Tax=Paenibacillus alkaliterrae TaxID=320909 RepID=UPI001F2D5541|nr:ABC transporter substrate-binding protein [Paenibacillus alkaliterrae]MCF2941815.1 ABC transporter substrate-binding protein [Paenibacillus alkaliterrae]